MKPDRNIIFLPSVGTYLNKISLNTYADLDDTDNAVHISQVSNEWLQNLSKTDFLEVFKK